MLNSPLLCNAPLAVAPVDFGTFSRNIHPAATLALILHKPCLLISCQNARTDSEQADIKKQEKQAYSTAALSKNQRCSGSLNIPPRAVLYSHCFRTKASVLFLFSASTVISVKEKLLVLFMNIDGSNHALLPFFYTRQEQYERKG
jgi:hypothetical protein